MRIGPSTLLEPPRDPTCHMPACGWGSCFCACGCYSSAIPSHLGDVGSGKGGQIPELIFLPLALPRWLHPSPGPGKVRQPGNTQLSSLLTVSLCL